MRLSAGALASLLLISCATAPPPNPRVRASAGSAAFAALVDDYFAREFAFSPSSGVNAGFHEFDPRLEDRSRGRIDARVAELKQFLARLQGMDRASLPFDDRIDAAAIENDILGTLLDLETLRVYDVNPMYYAGIAGGALDVLIKRDFAPAAERLPSLVSRLRGLPAIYAAARENLTNPPREFTDLAIRMSSGSVGYLEGTVASWAREAAAGDSKILAEFEAANGQAIAATRAFAEWLKQDLLPRSNGRYAIGAENFLLKMKYDDMVDLPLDRLLAIGEAQLAKDYAAFITTARQIDASRSAADVMKRLSDDHPTPEQLIPSVRNSVEAARQFLVERDIVTIPSEVRPLVEETPPYARSGGFASMSTPGPYERKATEAYYYVTPIEEEWPPHHKEEHLRLFNPYVVAMINVHEAWPGHYLQFLYAPQFPTKTRKLLYSGTNVEGWAHYAEQMMVDEGFGGGDPRYRLAQLQEALLRDVRYVAGIKLHTEGWTVEQAAKLFEEKAFQEPANAYEEARRGSYNPTYLYYTLGKIMIFELREQYMREKNASLKQFHDAFVAQGGLPIPLVRQILFRRGE
jgi:uncharacterized protein (DUF885 family)